MSDRDVWAYGTALRALSAEKGFSKHIGFSRLKDLVASSADGDKTGQGYHHLGKFADVEDDEIVYVCNATRLRHCFLARFGDEQLDVAGRIKEDGDTCMTYRGYIRFLATDLLNVYPTGPGRSKGQFKRGIEYIAKQMLYRGDVSSPSYPPFLMVMFLVVSPSLHPLYLVVGPTCSHSNP